MLCSDGGPWHPCTCALCGISVFTASHIVFLRGYHRWSPQASDVASFIASALPGTLRFVAQSRVGRISAAKHMDADGNLPESVYWHLLRGVATETIHSLNALLSESEIGVLRIDKVHGCVAKLGSLTASCLCSV